MSHYHRYLESKGDDNKLLKTIGDAKPFFDNNIWFFLLRLSNEQDFINWLDVFNADDIEYSHNDHVICEFCYLAIERLWRYHLGGKTVNDRVEILFRILAKAELKRCSELAIACVFAIMEIFNSEHRYEEARSLYESKYPKYEELPFAQLILNGSMGNSYFRDVAEVHGHALDYFKLSNVCVATSFYQRPASRVYFFLPILRNLLYLIVFCNRPFIYFSNRACFVSSRAPVWGADRKSVV